MTKLEELQTDLDTHRKSLKRLQDPDFRKKSQKGRIYNPAYDFDPNVLIPSYVKIIKSLEDEIAEVLASTKPKASKKKSK